MPQFPCSCSNPAPLLPIPSFKIWFEVYNVVNVSRRDSFSGTLSLVQSSFIGEQTFIWYYLPLESKSSDTGVFCSRNGLSWDNV